MKSLTFRRIECLLAVFTLTMVSLASCKVATPNVDVTKKSVKRSQTSSSTPMRIMINQALSIIKACPPWSEIEKSDINSRKKVLLSMKKLSSYSFPILREAVEKYIALKRRSNTYDVASMSRLYVLNRYIFAAPAKSPKGVRRFGSFHGIPSDNTSVNEMWPLSFGVKGEIELTGVFHGYYGEDYLALEEFDYFREKYGARQHN